MGFVLSKVQVTFNFLEDPGDIISTTLCVSGHYLMFLYGSFSHRKLFYFIFAHIAFDITRYFSLENLFLGKIFPNFLFPIHLVFFFVGQEKKILNNFEFSL